MKPEGSLPHVKTIKSISLYTTSIIHLITATYFGYAYVAITRLKIGPCIIRVQNTIQQSCRDETSSLLYCILQFSYSRSYIQPDDGYKSTAETFEHKRAVWSKNYSLPHSQAPATCPYPEAEQSCPCSHHPPSHLKIHFNIILPHMPRFSKWSPSIGCPHQNHVRTSPVPHTG